MAVNIEKLAIFNFGVNIEKLAIFNFRDKSRIVKCFWDEKLKVFKVLNNR